MTDGDDKKPKRPDPFAPLPLSETLTGPTKKSAPTRAPAPAPTDPEPPPPPAAPLPPTAFTSRTSGEHEAPIAPFESGEAPMAPFDTSAYEPPVVQEPERDEPSPIFTPDPDEQPAPELYPSAPAAAAAPAVEPSLVPTVYDENELRDAAGVTLIPDDTKAAKKDKKKKKRASTDDGDGDGDDGDDRPRSRLWLLVAAIAIVVGGTITTMVLVGRSNSERFVLACEADRVVILQGRSFPPWGESSLDGGEWKPMKIPPESPCAPFETKNKAELAARFERMLEDRALELVGGKGGQSTPTTAIGPEDPVAKVDEAEANLKQALLVSRHLASDNDRITKRDLLARLLGDVTYWRASARLRAAADALADAAKQFDAAAMQQPRANTDPGEWAALARRLADELRAGPRPVQPVQPGDLPPAVVPAQTSTAPPGVALPVEPPSEGNAAPPAPDAGVPSGGGVLL